MNVIRKSVLLRDVSQRLPVDSNFSVQDVAEASQKTEPGSECAAGRSHKAKPVKRHFRIAFLQQRVALPADFFCRGVIAITFYHLKPPIRRRGDPFGDVVCPGALRGPGDRGPGFTFITLQLFDVRIECDNCPIFRPVYSKQWRTLR